MEYWVGEACFCGGIVLGYGTVFGFGTVDNLDLEFSAEEMETEEDLGVVKDKPLADELHRF